MTPSGHMIPGFFSGMGLSGRMSELMPLMPKIRVLMPRSCHATHAKIFAHIIPTVYNAAHAPHAADVMPLMPKFMLAHV